MQFKASTDYGIRAILYLVAQGGTCSSRDIAEDMSIPRDYLIQLAQLLRNAGIIEARPGKHGGYRLAKKPEEISVLDVMNALDEETRNNTRERRAERKGNDMVEEVKLTYDLIEECFDAFMASLTMDSLLECVENKGNSREYLSNRLREEGQRLVEV